MFSRNGDEASLIAKWREGDEKAFDKLYCIHVHRLQQFAFRHTNDSALAEELVMNVMLKIWQRKAKLDSSTTTLSTFLFHLLRAELVDHYRKRKLAFVPLDTAMEHVEASDRADNHVVADELHKLYECGIDKLTPMQQKVYRMRHEHNQSYQQIAEHLQIAVKTVDRHLHSANLSIRAFLSKYGDVMLLIMAISFFC